MQRILSFKLDSRTPDSSQHLSQYLDDGWKVVNIALAAGGSGVAVTREQMDPNRLFSNPHEMEGKLLAWCVAVLEKH